MSKVSFVSVSDGCIEFYAGLGNLVVKSNDREFLAQAVIAAGGFDPVGVYGSSSIDFAEEYGFASQEAFDKLLNDVYDLTDELVSYA